MISGMMPRSAMRCIASSSGHRKLCAATRTHSGIPIAILRPTLPRPIVPAMARMATTRKKNGGGVAAKSRSVPRAAAIHVPIIQAAESNAASSAARRPSAASPPVRRQASATPQTNNATTASGRTTKIRTSSSARWYDGTTRSYATGHVARARRTPHVARAHRTSHPAREHVAPRT